MDRQATSSKGRDPTEHKNSFKCCSLGNNLTNMMVSGQISSRPHTTDFPQMLI